MNHTASISALQRLAAKWRAIGLVIAAFAQLMRRQEDGHVAGTFEQAQKLLIITRTAQVMLMHDLEEALEAEPPQTEHDEKALSFLRLVSVCLLAVYCVLENVLSRGVRAALIWQIMPATGPSKGRPAETERQMGRIPLLDPG